MQIQEPIREREITLTETEKEILIQACNIIDEIRDNMTEDEVLRVKFVGCRFPDDYDSYNLEQFDTMKDFAKCERLCYKFFD